MWLHKIGQAYNMQRKMHDFGGAEIDAPFSFLIHGMLI